MAGSAQHNAMALAAQQAEAYGAAFAQPTDAYAGASNYGAPPPFGVPFGHTQAHPGHATGDCNVARSRSHSGQAPHTRRPARQHGRSVSRRRNEDADACGQEAPKTLADWQEDVNNPKSKAYKCAPAAVARRQHT